MDGALQTAHYQKIKLYSIGNNQYEFKSKYGIEGTINYIKDEGYWNINSRWPSGSKIDVKGVSVVHINEVKIDKSDLLKLKGLPETVLNDNNLVFISIKLVRITKYSSLSKEEKLRYIEDDEWYTNNVKYKSPEDSTFYVETVSYH